MSTSFHILQALAIGIYLLAIVGNKSSWGTSVLLSLFISMVVLLVFTPLSRSFLSYNNHNPVSANHNPVSAWTVDGLLSSADACLIHPSLWIGLNNRNQYLNNRNQYLPCFYHSFKIWKNNGKWSTNRSCFHLFYGLYHTTNGMERRDDRKGADQH